MERRIRQRVVPTREVMAFIGGTRAPSKVVDYSSAGLAVEMSSQQVLSGKRCKVDIMIGERLCACGLPGIVRWSSRDAAGITLTPMNDQQREAAQRVETLAMMRESLNL